MYTYGNADLSKPHFSHIDCRAHRRHLSVLHAPCQADLPHAGLHGWSEEDLRPPATCQLVTPHNPTPALQRDALNVPFARIHIEDLVVFLSGTLMPVPSRGRWFSMPVQPTVVKPITPSSATWRPSLESTVAPWNSWLMRFLRRATLLYVVGFVFLICNPSLSPCVKLGDVWNTVYWCILQS